MEIKPQKKQKQAMSDEEAGAGTGTLKTDTKQAYVSPAGLGRKAPGQITMASTRLQTMPMVMNQWYVRQSITSCRRETSSL